MIEKYFLNIKQGMSNFPKKNTPPKIYIGCTGWSMKEWVGKVYPPKTPAKDYLKHYAKQFNTIECNAKTIKHSPSTTKFALWGAAGAPGRKCRHLGAVFG